MKLLKKTKKYLHVRMTNEEFVILEQGLKKLASDKQREQNLLDHAEWFFTNHIDVSWQDEYSSWHTSWKNVDTGEYVQAPDFSIRTYQHRFKDIIAKNKKKLGYKE